MNQKQVNEALDRALDSEFEDNFNTSVPMVIPEKVSVPATVAEEQTKVKENLYNTNEKLTAVLDYLVNNIEDLSREVGMIKTSPVNDIVSVAREISLINDKLYRYTLPQNPKNQNNRNITQNNIQFNKTDSKEEQSNEDFSLAKLDELIKTGKVS